MIILPIYDAVKQYGADLSPKEIREKMGALHNCPVASVYEGSD